MQWSSMSIVSLPFGGRCLWFSPYIEYQWFVDSPSHPHWNDCELWCRLSSLLCSWPSSMSTRGHDVPHRSLPKYFVRTDWPKCSIDLSVRSCSNDWNWNRPNGISVNLLLMNWSARHRNLNCWSSSMDWRRAKVLRLYLRWKISSEDWEYCAWEIVSDRLWLDRHRFERLRELCPNQTVDNLCN